MYPLGHLAIGYLVGKTTSEVFHVDVNLNALITLSLLPDIDLLIPVLPHRGPTHSIIVALALILPLFLIIEKTAIPYALTLVAHSAIGDLITGNVKLLWPIRTQCYTFIGIPIFSYTNIAMETSLFIVALLVLYRTGDYHALVQIPRLSDLISG